MTNVCQVSVRGLSDENGAYIPGVLEIVNQEIEASLARGALPIVHCNSTMHRAPSALLVFLLKRAGVQLSFNEALSLVVKWRPPAFRGDHAGQTPTNQFLNQIESFHRKDPAAIGLPARRKQRGEANGRFRCLHEPPQEGVHY